MRERKINNGSISNHQCSVRLPVWFISYRSSVWKCASSGYPFQRQRQYRYDKIPAVIIWFVAKDRYPDTVKLLELYAGFGAVLGHNFPFYMKFKGGKGIASSVGIIFTFDWRMVPICAILFFASVVPTGFMSLGSLGILSGFFVQTIVFGQMGWLKIATQFLPEVYVLTGILTALAFLIILFII